jgi:hypothetical protein
MQLLTPLPRKSRQTNPLICLHLCTFLCLRKDTALHTEAPPPFIRALPLISVDIPDSGGGGGRGGVSLTFFVYRNDWLAAGTTGRIQQEASPGQVENARNCYFCNV